MASSQPFIMTREEWLQQGGSEAYVGYRGNIITARDYANCAHSLLDGSKLELASVEVEPVPREGLVRVRVKAAAESIVYDLAAVRLLKENWPYELIAVNVVVRFHLRKVVDGT